MVHQCLIARCVLSLLLNIVPFGLLAQNSFNTSTSILESSSDRMSSDWHINVPPGLCPGTGLLSLDQLRGGSEEGAWKIGRPDAEADEFRSAVNAWVGDSTFQVNGASVFAMLWHQGKLYVGGDFMFADTIQVNNIAVWDSATNQWSRLDSGIEGFVRVIIPFGDDIIVGGEFEKAGEVPARSVARWDGTSWHALGEGFDNPVYALALFQGGLIAGGEFNYSGGEYTPGIARWDGIAWRTISESLDSRVYALTATDSVLYVGGGFIEMGGVPARYVARWDGMNWSSIGAGVGSNVYALEIWNGELYAGGDFFYDGSSSVALNSIGVWDGSQWNPLGIGINSQVLDFQATDSGLCVVGNFTAVDGLYSEGIARWDGSSWHQIEQVEGVVNVATSDGQNLYLGGMLSRVHDEQGLHVARLSDTKPTRLGIYGVKGNFRTIGVNALAVIGDELYVGGSFTSAGTVPVSFIARWNRVTEEWSSLGEGVNAQVLSFHVADGQLYVGGEFTRAGEGAAHHIARWDPTTEEWTSLGAMPNWVNAIVTRNDTLYAGGYGVWKQVNNQWQRVDQLQNDYGRVLALHVYNDQVYVGGYFHVNGILGLRGIFRLDESRLELVGAVNGFVYDIETWKGELYIGGGFSTANGVYSIARLKGNAWERVGDYTVKGTVYALAVASDGLYIGGLFRSISDLDAPYVARWDGDTWSPLDRGLDWFPRAAAADGEEVYFGGYFRNPVSGQPGLAHWRGVPASVQVSGDTRQTLQLSLIPDREGASGTLVIEGRHTGEDRVGFYGLLGEQIFSTKLSDLVRTGEGRYRLDLSVLPTGSCFVLLRTGEGSRSARLLVVR